jgi:hypothetical protein
MSQNGVEGYKVTGPNGNSIFLPAAGYRHWSSLYNAGSTGYYWSSTPGVYGIDNFAGSLNFSIGNEIVTWYDSRGNGFTVRPVSE